MPKYIELEKALEFLQHKYENMYGCNPSFYAGYQLVLENLKRIKSADVAPVVHGRWESEKNPNWPAHSHDKCSLCGWWNTRNAQCYEKGHKAGHSLNYCPNCGAKMDLEG